MHPVTSHLIWGMSIVNFITFLNLDTGIVGGWAAVAPLTAIVLATTVVVDVKE